MKLSMFATCDLYSDYNDDYVHLKQHDPGLLPCFPHQQHTDSFLIISSA